MSSNEVQAQEPARVPVLWMDDEPTGIDYVRRFIDAERQHFCISIEVSRSIEETRNRLSTGKYGALVADCRMDELDLSENGAEFLYEVSRMQRALPLFVFSAFLDDPRYDQYLQLSPVVAKAGKTDDLDPPLAGHEFFRKLDRAAVRYYAVKDLYPELVQFRKYRSDPKKYESVLGAHWQRHSCWIQAEAVARGFVWVVVVGDAIVKGSSDLDEYPNEEELVQIGEAANLVPFAYGFVVPPEDTVGSGAQGIAWGQVGKADWYPRISVELGGVRIEDDFDTGAQCTHVSDRLVPRGFLDFWLPSEVGHLGLPYRYFVKKVPLKVVDSYGTSRLKEVAVSVVDQWASSGFVIVNPARRCLIGRDLLQAFAVVVVLDSGNRLTIVRHLGPDEELCPFLLEGAAGGVSLCPLFVGRKVDS